MTDAPERIWTCNETTDIFIIEPQEDTTEYVRKDVSDALVAAAYEGAAVVAEDANDGIWDAQTGDKVFLDSTAEEIRRGTPADARAALDRIRQEARQEALREAINIYREFACDETRAEAAILALITKEADNA